MSIRTAAVVLGMGLLALGLVSGCQTLREVSALKEVRFRLERVGDVSLVGIALDDVRSYEDFGFREVQRLTAALSRGEMPLSFTAHVEATNPEDNGVTARLTNLEWTVFLQEQETVAGVVEEDLRLVPGTPEVVPVDVSLDLLRFFSDNLSSLADLALAVAGRGAETAVALRVNPTLRTPLGPMRSGPITVGQTTVGGESEADTP